MTEFIEVFNYVAKVARPAHAKVAIADSMADAFQDIGLDSLDGLVMLMYFDELYHWSGPSVGWLTAPTKADAQSCQLL